MKGNKLYSFKEWTEAFVSAVIIALILYFLAWPFTITGNSMENNFYTGDRIIISRALVFFGSIHRGDVVVCEQNGSKDIIKRVIGLPGEQLEIKDGLVYINDTLLDEPYLKEAFTDGSLLIKLEDDEYFVMGDNRSISQDSRDLGPFELSSIVGKTIVKWYPFNHFELY